MPKVPVIPRLQSLWRNRDGVSIIEFAIIAPVFFLLLLGFVEVGWAAYRHAAVSHAVSEAARYGAVRGAASNAPIGASVLEAWTLHHALLTGSGALASASFTPDNKPGSTVQVQVTYPHTPIIGKLFGSLNVTMTASSEITITR